MYGEDSCRCPRGAAEWVIAAPTYAAKHKVQQLFQVFSKNATAVPSGDSGLQDLQDVVAATNDTNELRYPRLAKNHEQWCSPVGTHRAVKLCRWTTSTLRGRGGRYKHTFHNNLSSRNGTEIMNSEIMNCMFWKWTRQRWKGRDAKESGGRSDRFTWINGLDAIGKQRDHQSF